MSGLFGKLLSGSRLVGSLRRSQSKGSDKSQERRVYKLACLGHAASGKTTFWTTLHASTHENPDQFYLRTADNTTNAYLQQQVSAMKAGINEPLNPRPYTSGYPEQTDSVVELQFEAVSPRGPDVLICIQDYPGGAIAIEDDVGDFPKIATFMKEADGVFFFVDAPTTRAGAHILGEQILAFNALLRRLEDQNGRIRRPVGVIVTASDRFSDWPGGRNRTDLYSVDLQSNRKTYSEFKRDILRRPEFGPDAAWRDRVAKTLDRLKVLIDALRKKCRSTRLFFVSAPGNSRLKPIEPWSVADDSIYVDKILFAIGKNQVGIQAPAEWMTEELLKGRSADSGLQKRILMTAALWAMLVSLPFAGYLGCSVRQVERQMAKDTIHVKETFHALATFQNGFFPRIWGGIDRRGYMSVAAAVVDTVGERIVRDGKQAALSVLSVNNANGHLSESAEYCDQWSKYLKSCVMEMPSGHYKEYAQCWDSLFVQITDAFRQQSNANDRKSKFVGIAQQSQNGLCLDSRVRDTLQRCAESIEIDPNGNGGSIRNDYNARIEALPPSPIYRLDPKLIEFLKDLRSRTANDEASKRIKADIDRFLEGIAPFRNGVPVRLRILTLANPVSVQFAEPGTFNFSGDQHLEGDEVSIGTWRIGQSLNLKFCWAGKCKVHPLLGMSSNGISELLEWDQREISDQITNVNETMNVQFMYQVVSPEINDQTIPPLSPVQ